MKPVRRIITGHRADGRPTVLADAPAPNVKQGTADRAARDVAVPPPRRGTIFRIAEFPPRTGGEVRDNETVLRDFGIGADVKRGAPPRHPEIHRTRSLDYVIVLEGEIDLLLDDGEVRLSAGDVVVQRATHHAWINRGDAEEPPELG